MSKPEKGTPEYIAQVIKVCSDSAIFLPTEFDEEAYRINLVEEDSGKVYLTGEESGDEVTIYLNEIDLDKAMFYKYVLVDNFA